MMINKLNNLVILFLIVNVGFCIAQDKPLKIKSERNPDNSVTFSYTKKSPGSTYIILKFKIITIKNI